MMSNDDLCVYCGGSNHPALCGEPLDEAPVPWLGILLAIILPLVAVLYEVIV